MEFIGRWAVTSIAVMSAVWLVPGIDTVGGDYAGPIMCALALALVNATLKPILALLSFPMLCICSRKFKNSMHHSNHSCTSRFSPDYRASPCSRNRTRSRRFRS